MFCYNQVGYINSIVSRYEVSIEYRGSIGNVVTHAFLGKFSELINSTQLN